MSVTSRRIAVMTCVAGAALLLTACGSLAGSPSGPTAEPIDELCADPLVITCDSVGDATIVAIDGDASDERVTEFAGRLRASTASTTEGTVVMRGKSRDPRVLDTEVAPRPKWEVRVWPGEREQFDAALSNTLTAAAVPGATGIIVAGDWPYVAVETLDQFEDVFTELSSTPLLHTGGTYPEPFYLGVALSIHPDAVGARSRPGEA